MRNERKNALDKKFHATIKSNQTGNFNAAKPKTPLCGRDCGYFQITPASISYHLSLLLKSGLICCRQVEKRRIYSINRGSLDEVYLWLTGLYQSQI